MEMLTNWGMNPTAVSSGNEALSKMRESSRSGHSYPLVLLDAHMPNMDGFELAERISKNNRLAQATIMMLTSGHQKGDSIRCREVGISQYLIKPIKQSELFDAIVNALYRGNEEMKQKIRAYRRTRKKEYGDEFVAKAIGRKLNLLLAEDNPINRKLAETLIRKKDWEIVSVCDGLEAVQAHDSEHFDVILMDVQMPKMDGFEATRIIREKEEETGEHIPIIAITAHAMKGDRDKCLEAGMDDYVSKPMKAQELYAAIARLLAENGEEADGPQEEPGEEIIDLGRAMDAVDGDKDLLKELVEDFLEDFPQQLEILETVIREGDSEQVERTAHSLKGNVGVFGSQTAYDLAYELEKFGKDSELDKAQNVFQKLKNEMAKLKTFYSQPGWDQYA